MKLKRTLRIGKWLLFTFLMLSPDVGGVRGTTTYLLSDHRDALYESANGKPWIEMQIVQGYDPFTHRVNVLQPIEKESPELLLPYYHQAVEHYIRLKNRHDYKSAVRLLKRLEKVYKKMKQPERWEAFFTRFVSRYQQAARLAGRIEEREAAGMSTKLHEIVVIVCR